MSVVVASFWSISALENAKARTWSYSTCTLAVKHNNAFLHALIWCTNGYVLVFVLLPQVQWSVYISPLLLWPSGGRQLISLQWLGQATPELWPSSGGSTTAPRWEVYPPPATVSHIFHPVQFYFPLSQFTPDAADYIVRVNFADFSQIMQNLIAHGCPLSYWQIQLGWFVKFIMLIVFSAVSLLIIQWVRDWLYVVFNIMQLFVCSSFVFFPFEIQPIITLEGSISHTFHRVGKNKVTLQVACGSTVMQDSKVITVRGELGEEASKYFIKRYTNVQYGIWRKCLGRFGRRCNQCLVNVDPA